MSDPESSEMVRQDNNDNNNTRSVIFGRTLMTAFRCSPLIVKEGWIRGGSRETELMENDEAPLWKKRGAKKGN